MALNTNIIDHQNVTELLLTVALNTKKTYHHGITDILLTVALNTNKTDHHSITKLLIITLFNAQFYPEGLKAYTRNIYKQRTQVK
jgi:hypothetical protein